ncbi:MAG: hypothetical protein AB1765_08840 [Candidatus Hydrogenedentota bacterium]
MNKIYRILLACILIIGFSSTLFAKNIFSDLKKLITKKRQEIIQTKTIWFTLYLTNNKTIECLDTKSPYNPSSIKVLTDYESVSKIQLKYIKYIDFSKTNKNILENEWANAENDIIHLINSDIMSGTITGFAGDSCKIETPYGTHNVLLNGVDYIIIAKREELPKKEEKKQE